MKDNGMKKTLENIPLTAITEPDDPSRNRIDSDGIRELAESLNKIGQLQPILLRKKEGRYEVEAGHRRFLAAKSLNWSTIDAIVLNDGEEEDTHLERAHENLIRENLNPVDEAKLVWTLVYHDGRGVESTAKMLCKSEGWVEARMNVLQWPEELISAIEAGQISLTNGKILSKVQDQETRSRLLDSTIEYSPSKRVLERWISDMDTLEYLSNQDIRSESAEIQSADMGTVHMECRVCAYKFQINHMRHIWLCPDCMMAMRNLANELRNEMAKQKGELE